MKRFGLYVAALICGITVVLSAHTAYAYTPSDILKEEGDKYFYKGSEVTYWEYTKLKNRLDGFDTYEAAYESVVEGYKCNEIEAAYMYIYLNDDDVPELLVMEAGKNNGGGVVYYFTDKKIKKTQIYKSETLGKNGVFGYVPYRGRVLHESIDNTQGNMTIVRKIYYVDIEENYSELRAEYIEQQLAGKSGENGLYRINGKYVEENEYNDRWTSSTEGMILVGYEDCHPIIKNIYECSLHNAKYVKRNICPAHMLSAFEYPMVWRFIEGDMPAYYGKYYEYYDEKEIKNKDIMGDEADISTVQVNNMWDFNNGGTMDEIFIEGEYGGACFYVGDGRVYMMLRGEDHLYNLDYTENDGDMWLFTYAMPLGEWQNYEFWKFNRVGEIEDSLRLEYAYDDYYIDGDPVEQSRWYETRDRMLKNAHHRSWIVGEKE